MRDRRRDLGALLVAVAALAVAALVGSKVAYYTAPLIVSSTRMARFGLTRIERVERADS